MLDLVFVGKTSTQFKKEQEFSPDNFSTPLAFFPSELEGNCVFFSRKLVCETSSLTWRNFSSVFLNSEAITIFFINHFFNFRCRIFSELLRSSFALFLRFFPIVYFSHKNLRNDLKTFCLQIRLHALEVTSQCLKFQF